MLQVLIDVLSAVFAGGGTLAAVWETFTSRRTQRSRATQVEGSPLEERFTQPSVENRAVRVAELLRESGTILDELTAEMTTRAAMLEQLRTDTEQAQRVAEIHKEQQDAVTRLLRIELEKQEKQLRAELAKQGRRSFWQGLAVNIGVGLLFFIAGVLATVELPNHA